MKTENWKLTTKKWRLTRAETQEQKTEQKRKLSRKHCFPVFSYNSELAGFTLSCLCNLTYQRMCFSSQKLHLLYAQGSFHVQAKYFVPEQPAQGAREKPKLSWPFHWSWGDLGMLKMVVLNGHWVMIMCDICVIDVTWLEFAQMVWMVRYMYTIYILCIDSWYWQWKGWYWWRGW